MEFFEIVSGKNVFFLILSFLIFLCLLSAIFILKYGFDFKYFSITIIIIAALCAMFLLISIILLFYIIYKIYSFDPIKQAYIYRMSSPMSSYIDKNYKDPNQKEIDKSKKIKDDLEEKFNKLDRIRSNYYLMYRQNPNNEKIQVKYRKMETDAEEAEEKFKVAYKKYLELLR